MAGWAKLKRVADEDQGLERNLSQFDLLTSISPCHIGRAILGLYFKGNLRENDSLTGDASVGQGMLLEALYPSKATLVAELLNDQNFSLSRSRCGW